MCAIAGQLALRSEGSVDPADVLAMVRTMVHRGPDDEGTFTNDAHRVALAMRRLAIIDLESGHQPVFNEDGQIVCVFNGEIYNYRDLRAELEARGHCFRSMSDTEVIVHLYEEEGSECVRRLNGMFAFAIWDEGAQELLIARDRLGKKPVYYAEVAGRLCFASEITALHGLHWLPREVDLVALDLYLTHSYVPAPYSIFQAMRKLPPGHRLMARGGRVEIEPYWRLSVAPTWPASREEILRELKVRLEKAVRLRMIADVPLGCFLSGGTDSSTVVAVMSRLSSHPVKTFSIGFTYEPMSELEYARTAAHHFHTDHHEFVVEADAVSVLPQIVRHFGEPFGDSSALPTWYVAELARRDVTVALNGDGGDELFAGYPWYENALRLDRLARLVPAWAARRIGSSSSSDGRLPRLVRRLGMSSAERFASLRRFLEPVTRERLYSKEFRRRLDSVAERYLLDRYESVDAEEIARMQYTDIMTYLPEDLLVKVDRMTMAHSLEGRSPLLDHELVEFCARIPGAWKLGKRIFRDAVRDLFPPGFLDRPKMGFAIPVAPWLRRELRAECERKIFHGALRDQGWLDLGEVQVLFDEHVAGWRDWSAQIWNLLMLALWTEQFAV